MNDQQYKLIVDSARKHGAKFPTQADWLDFKAAIDAATGNHPEIPGSSRRTVSPRGIALMQEFEGCKLAAYPDPGSRDGNPWTIGYGATGTGIAKGVTWTQAECDARFAEDVAKFAAKVEALLGDTPTDQSQFDAMVSLAFNIGLEGFRKSTVLRKHKAGDHAGAAAAFGLWNKNDGVVMRGLVRRRAAEAALYLVDG